MRLGISVRHAGGCLTGHVLTGALNGHALHLEAEDRCYEARACAVKKCHALM